MHWPVMLADYNHAMGLDGETAMRLHGLFDTGGQSSDLRYPEPDEPHPVGASAQTRKIKAAIATGAKIMPSAHGYGPLEDVISRVRTAFEAGGGRVWINRYGYLSDTKLDAFGGN